MNYYIAPAFDIEALSKEDIIRTSGGEIDLPEMPTGENDTYTVENL